MKYLKKGSYTIEAALLFPIILCIIVIIIISAFYLHDRTALNAKAYQLAVRGCSLIEKTDSEIEVEMRSAASQEIHSILLGAKSVQYTVSVTEDKITVQLTAAGRQIPFTAGQIYRLDFPQISVSKSVIRDNAPDLIRKARVIKELTKEK